MNIREFINKQIYNLKPYNIPNTEWYYEYMCDIIQKIYIYSIKLLLIQEIINKSDYYILRNIVTLEFSDILDNNNITTTFIGNNISLINRLERIFNIKVNDSELIQDIIYLYKDRKFKI